MADRAKTPPQGGVFCGLLSSVIEETKKNIDDEEDALWPAERRRNWKE